jgi:type 1 fimbria pilin
MKKLLISLCLILPIMAFAQTSGSLQRVTLTSVTLVMDSVKSPNDVELIRSTIQKYQQVKDFDIKGKNCDFTIDNSQSTLDLVFSDLAQVGQPGRIYALRENQTFTIVPEESCESAKRNVPDKSEEEVKKEGIQRRGGN